MKFIHRILSLLLPALVCSVSYSQTDSTQPNTTIFTRVDKEAEFPGGEAGWRKFLEKNLNANVPADRGAPVGIYVVIVQFVVNTEGKVSDIKALTNQGYGTEQEVVRILKLSGAWEPAMLDGKPVNAYRKQPVTFVLTEDGLEVTPLMVTAGKETEITIQVRKVKSEDLYVTISRGTIKPAGGGKFLVRVNGNNRAIIRIYNAKKDNKELGTVSLEVKTE